jgi:hypothetical protein
LLIFVDEGGSDETSLVKVVSTRTQTQDVLSPKEVVAFALAALGNPSPLTTTPRSEKDAVTGKVTDRSSLEGAAQHHQAATREISLYIFSTAAFARESSKQAKDNAYRESKLVEGAVVRHLAQLGSTARVVHVVSSNKASMTTVVANKAPTGGIRPLIVIATDASQRTLRDFSTTLCCETIANAEAFIASQHSSRRQLKAVLAMADRDRAQPILLYSTVDETFISM